MNVAIDFLPAAYRQRQQRARTRREQLLLAIPVALGLFATDLVLQARVDSAANMAQQAESHAARAEQDNEQVQQLAKRLAETQSQIERLVAPLAAPRLTALLDDLLADRPTAITIQEMSCRHEPWGNQNVPAIRVVAHSKTPTAFSSWLKTLGEAAALPALQCPRTSESGAGGLNFQLETATPGAPR